MRTTLALIVSTLALVSSPSARAQDSGPFPEPVYGGGIEAPHRNGPVDRPRLGAHMSLGGGGDIEFSGTGFTADADPTIGLGANFFYPLLTYVSVGGQFDLLWVKADGMSGGRSTLMDFMAVVEGRYPFRVADHDAEAYFQMPVGLSVLFPDDPNLDNGAGFALSLLFGGRIWVTDNLGIYTNLGWGIHHTHNDIRGASGTVEPILRQMIFHIGAHFAL